MRAQSSVPPTSAYANEGCLDRSQRLQAVVVSLADLRPDERSRMFALMQNYYDGVDVESFESDLSRKEKVILLKAQGVVQGFSTLVSVQARVNGRNVYGIFSGDTVVEKQYWGQSVLGRAFLRRLFLEKLKRPFTPLYWLLLSKGYKTYLMMANNFAEHYPRVEKSAPPDRQAIAHAFYKKLFPEWYDASTGLITFPRESCRLKQGVAEISDTLIETNPRVAFFVRANPEWAAGVELACLAKMTLSMPLRYALKKTAGAYRTTRSRFPE
jgi:hypothetical protein